MCSSVSVVCVRRSCSLGSAESRLRTREGHRCVREYAEMSLETQATVYRVRTFNLNSDEWDATRDREGWRGKGTLVGQRIGGELIRGTMSEGGPGGKLLAYHTHY